MWDFLETIIGIIIIFIFAVLGGLLFVSIAVVLTPGIIIIMAIIGIIWILDSIINLIRVCVGKEEKHILNITIEEGEDNNDKGRKDI